VITQNRALLNGGTIAEVTEAVGVGTEVALYLCVMGLKGVCLVIGTKNLTHMIEVCEGYKWQNWVDHAANKANWGQYMARFKSVWGLNHSI
jgi:hypothetical protein